MLRCIILVLVAVYGVWGAAVEEPENHGKEVEEMGAALMRLGNNSYDGGDLKLTEEQKQVLYGKSGRTRYGGSYKYATLWKDAVLPYTIRTADFWSSSITEMKKAMIVIEQETCIRFKPRTTEKNYVRIQDGKEGCNSYLGNVRKGAQPLNLQHTGCLQFGTYLHEFGHALGLLHEHQLPNRDDYVKYFPENVKSDQKDQLNKYNNYMARLHGVDYDLSSIMHYELTAFAKDKTSLTLGVVNTFWQHHIGRRYSHILSFGDVKTLNRMYRCADKCGKKECPEPGFLNHNCHCVTPERYHNKFCKDDWKQVAWCEKQAKRGYCDRTDDYMQTHCAKTCDFCPKFVPGTSGIVVPEKEECVNEYSVEENCEKWAKEGLCTYYPEWLQRHCRKSCDKYAKTCSKKIGKCANRLSDHDCEWYANHIIWNYCGSYKHWGYKARFDCPDSCKSCPKYNEIPSR